ncbi:hypothetical protein HDE_13161 [Halotydeus destructor]|nr:hypothetical protein HDE_13161 [Halotydeus destructor]
MASSPQSGHQEEHTDERLNRPSALEYFDDNANTFRFMPTRGMARGSARPLHLDQAYSPHCTSGSVGFSRQNGLGLYKELRFLNTSAGRNQLAENRKKKPLEVDHKDEDPTSLTGTSSRHHMVTRYRSAQAEMEKVKKAHHGNGLVRLGMNEKFKCSEVEYYFSLMII